MNLKETKIALENSVKEVLLNAVNKDGSNNISVTANYNTDQGCMNVTIVENNEAKPEEKKNANILYYGINYTEEGQSVSIIAFNRVFVADELSVVNVVIEPVVIDDNFMATVKNLIMFGMDKVYNPQNYEVQTEEMPESSDANN